MEHFFIFGRQPALSLAELINRYGFAAGKNRLRLLAGGRVALAEAPAGFEPLDEIKKLGGLVKLGRIKGHFARAAENDIAATIARTVEAKTGKFNYGLSVYGRVRINEKKLAMEIKSRLRARSVPSRWVSSREKVLSSVVVGQNRLLKDGAEYVFIGAPAGLYWGRTLAVQPYRELSARDYGRPGRDDRSGMLPPKLAQIMINLSRTKPDGVLLDPFCGSGTILTEALIMGYKNLIGADISAQAVADTKANIAWTKNILKSKTINLKLFIGNVKHLSGSVSPRSVDAIVTEPYLGPQRGQFDVKKTITELENLYRPALDQFKQILKTGGRIVMVWPVFRDAGKTYRLNFNPLGWKIINPLPEKLSADYGSELTDRHTIVYGRPGQRVWREIAVLTPISK